MTEALAAPAKAGFWESIFRPSQKILALARRLDRSQLPFLWVVALFAAQAFPAAVLRAANLEEGRIIALARGAVEDGHWITPFYYGERFAERPVLLSWICAAFGELVGHVSLLTLRLPHLAFFLAGALLIYKLVRTHTGAAAAIFAAFCWMSMPLVAPKFINAEADIVLSTLLFAAFYCWWEGTTRPQFGFRRWVMIVALVALAGLTKGPQPVAYFSLGCGLYTVLRDRSRLPAFLLANIAAAATVLSWYILVHDENGDVGHWLAHSRLGGSSDLNWIHDHIDFLKSILIETLPAAILFVPAVITLYRRYSLGGHDLLLAAVLYSAVTTAVLLAWPGGVSARYAMPATMALAVVCGLMFEQWKDHQARAVAGALLVAYLIYGGLLVRGWLVMPLRPELFEQSRLSGRAIEETLRGTNQTLYVITGSTDHNMLVYVRSPIRAVSVERLAGLKEPAEAILTDAESADLAKRAPSIEQLVIGTVSAGPARYGIVRLAPKPS